MAFPLAFRRSSMFPEGNKVSFPPFTFFTHLICSEAKVRNDPILKLSNIRYERPLYKHGASSVPVLVHKTEVSKNSESDSASLKETVKRD